MTNLIERSSVTYTTLPDFVHRSLCLLLGRAIGIGGDRKDRSPSHASLCIREKRGNG